MTKRSEVQSAVKAARQSGTCALSNGWSVRVERVYNMPRGGPMAAWKYIYYLVSPENKAFGGYDRADSFVSWATEYKRYAVNYAP